MLGDRAYEGHTNPGPSSTSCTPLCLTQARPSAKRLRKAQRGKGYWQRQLTEDGDIEANPGPSCRVHVCSLNCGGSASALQALGDLAAQKIDFFGLQETRMSPHQAAAWQREAMRLGYRAWVHPGYHATDSMERTYYHHGLAVAVKANLPAAERARVDESAGQGFSS